VTDASVTAMGHLSKPTCLVGHSDAPGYKRGGPLVRGHPGVGTPGASPSLARSPSSGVGPATERSPTRTDPSRGRLSGAYLEYV
jgi:hypothetical protein